jgi:hypothetical protein
MAIAFTLFCFWTLESNMRGDRKYATPANEYLAGSEIKVTNVLINRTIRTLQTEPVSGVAARTAPWSICVQREARDSYRARFALDGGHEPARARATGEKHLI